jgi:hypothetical protein
MNARAKAPQDYDLRLSSGLFLPGLKIDKLDGIQIDRQKGIIDRSGKLSEVSGFIAQELVEGT